MLYQPALDGLRAISVILVLGQHGSYGHFPGGCLGVNVFFVLSGFLITSILMDEHGRTGGVAKKRFYYRRALRLLPALVATLVLTGLLWRLCVWPGSFYFGASASLFYFANWVRAADLGTLGAFDHMWSLSVEEQFYFVWPFVLPALLTRTKRASARAKVLGASVLALAGVRSMLWYEGSALADYSSTLARADALVLGAALAAAFRDSGFLAIASSRLGQAAGGMGLLATVLGAALIDENQPWLYTHGGFTLFGLAAAAMVANAATAAHGPFAGLLATRPLVWIGKRSYGIYLYHFAIFQALEELRVPGSLTNFAYVTALRFAVTIVIAAASYAWIEERFLQLKARLAPHEHERPGTSMAAAGAGPLA